MLLEFKFKYLTEFKLMNGNIDSNILLNISFFMILVVFFYISIMLWFIVNTSDIFCVQNNV